MAVAVKLHASGGLWLLAFGYWLLAIGCWLLAIGCWLLAIGYWLLAVGCWLLAIGCWLFYPAVLFDPEDLSCPTGECGGGVGELVLEDQLQFTPEVRIRAGEIVRDRHGESPYGWSLLRISDEGKTTIRHFALQAFGDVDKLKEPHNGSLYRVVDAPLPEVPDQVF
jgi:hypothetical protein